jgi:hypothetical protein
MKTIADYFRLHGRDDEQDDAGPDAERDERNAPDTGEPGDPIIWMPVEKGQYAGKNKTLPQIIMQNPGWFFYCWNDGQFEPRSPYRMPTPLEAQAAMIHRRAAAIRLKPGDVVEYVVFNGKFEGLNFCPQDRGVPRTRPYLNMSVPLGVDPNDRGAKRLVLYAMKEYFFGARVTKKRAEAFFGNPAHFINP